MPRAEEPAITPAESTPLLSGSTATQYGGNLSVETPTSQEPSLSALSEAVATHSLASSSEAGRKGIKQSRLGDVFSLQNLVKFLKDHGKFLCVLAIVEVVILLWGVLKPESHCHGEVRTPTSFFLHVATDNVCHGNL